MKRILFPVEDMTISDKALALAAEFSQSLKAEVVLLHVQPFSEPMSYPYAHLAEPWDEEVFNQISERIIAHAQEQFLKVGITATSRIITGSAASEIVECAGEENCDLIIMTTHTMSTAKRFLLGSVTNKVVIHSKVPVLVVR